MTAATPFAVLSLLLAALLPALSSFSPPHLERKFCNDQNGYVAANSTMERNLRKVLQQLPLNLSSGYNDMSYGNIPNVIHGRALCRGDVGYSACERCVAGLSEKIERKCNLTLDGIIWSDYCQVHYTPLTLSEVAAYAGQFVDDWESDLPAVRDPDRFLSDVSNFMLNLSIKAIGNQSGKLFAVGRTKSSGGGETYGLVQCFTGMNPAWCYSCLKAAVTELSNRRGRPSGIVLAHSCNVRFEPYKFFSSPSRRKYWKRWVTMATAASGTLLLLATASVSYFWCARRIENEEKERKDKIRMALAPSREIILNLDRDVDSMSIDEMRMDLSALREATNDFAEENIVGRGGSSIVYKGILDGKEIAVKKLSNRSGQGAKEFKNEVILVAALQHINLVKLRGCAVEGDEKMLVYEFMPNRSLDLFIFDTERRRELQWSTYYNIITGIARGLNYLHKDSQHTVFHRDLKPSNILLDENMAAKISDFGIAKIFFDDQLIQQSKLVGTFGYMAPEYAMKGEQSEKIDVFSFGVILLEILNGQRNSGFHEHGGAPSLVDYAFLLWNGRREEFIDASLLARGNAQEMVRVMHIGLLCVEANAASRPTMSAVLSFLENDVENLPTPKEPAFFPGRLSGQPLRTSAVSRPTDSEDVPR